MTDEADSYYAPDWEDLAYECYKEREFESLRLEYEEIHLQLREYRKHTNRRLRDLSKEAKSISHELRNAYQFDVASDSYDVDLDGETSITVSRNGVPRDEVSRPLRRTRKDKRRAKTEQRRAARYLRIWRTQWEKSRAASVVRKTGALPPVVAGMCHA